MYDKKTKSPVGFVLIDKDGQGVFPSNFVCILPFKRQFLLKGSNYANIIPENGLAFAEKSLTDALKSEEDLDIIKAIKSRLQNCQTAT